MPQPKATVKRRHDVLDIAPKKRGDNSSEGFGWAVSYSDLLMVLLAFFVLYFQFGEQKSESILTNIVHQLKDNGDVGAPATGTGTGTGIGNGGTSGTAAPQDFGALSRAIAEVKDPEMTLQVGAKNKALVLHFPDSFYAAGKFQLTADNRQRIEKLLKVVAPFRDTVDLVFIGHTDEAAVPKKATQIVDSNLVLSNLRAARAAEFSLSQGFDPRHVSAQGVGEYQRKARSLSLKILERGEL